MQRLVRVVDWIGQTVEKNKQDVMGLSIGGSTGFIAQHFFTDWVKPVLISTSCAVVGLLISHYGKKLLKWVDSKLL